MSAYVDVKTCYKKHNMALLAEALREMGYEVETHEKPVGLYGYHGDLRPQKANVVVRRRHVGPSANDIGWEFNEDGTCTEHISEYDRGHTFKKVKQDKLAQTYAEKVVTQAAKKSGFKMGKTIEADGSIKMKLTRTKW